MIVRFFFEALIIHRSQQFKGVNVGFRWLYGRNGSYSRIRVLALIMTQTSKLPPGFSADISFE